MKTINQFTYAEINNYNCSNPTIPSWIMETYAQYGEDIIIEAILKAFLSRNTQKQYSFTYIEIGANHPISTNSSYLFYKKYNASGILIEANPELISELKRVRPRDLILNYAISNNDSDQVEFYISKDTEISSLNEEFVKAWDKEKAKNIKKVKNKRINSILELAKNVDLLYLSIDVEGLDLNLIKDIDYEKYCPFIIQCEPGEGFRKGTKKEIIDFLQNKNYMLLSETEGNLIFINKKYLNE